MDLSTRHGAGLLRPLAWLRQMRLYTIPRRRARRRAARQPKLGSESKRHSRDTRGTPKSMFPRAEPVRSGDACVTAQTVQPAFLAQGSDTA